MKRILIILLSACALVGGTAVTASAVSDITSHSATADGNDFSGDICSSPGLVCTQNKQSGTYLVNANAKAGQPQWTTYNRICYTTVTGDSGREIVKAQWGPFSTSVESKPLSYTEYDKGSSC